jgi:hypothetical protein
MEQIGDRDDAEHARDETRHARCEDEPIPEQGSDPLPETVWSGEQFAQRTLHPRPAW